MEVPDVYWICFAYFFAPIVENLEQLGAARALWTKPMLVDGHVIFSQELQQFVADQ